MLYKPSDKINFGVHNGFEIAKIYQFNPSYLEWGIKYIPTFEIELNDFDKLPRPTPYFKNSTLYHIEDNEYGYAASSNIPDAEDYLAAGNEINKAEFIFSESSIDILEEKKRGVYNCPGYVRVTHEVIKIEDLF